MCPSGNATLTTPCVTPKYWTWPEWNTDSVYFNSRTGLGETSSLQLRAFYVRYANTMAMFDDEPIDDESERFLSANSDNRDHSAGVSGTGCN